MGARVTQGAWVGEVTDREAWNGFVERAPITTVMHRWEWREIIETTYGHQSIYLGAFRGSELTGVLPLVSMTRPLSGTRLVSMPFGEGGGPCATDDDVARSLVGEARDRAARAKAVLDLRTTQDLGLDMPVSLDKVAMVLELGDSAEALWGRLPAERRNRVKKAGREGLTATVDGLEALDDFYGVFARNMRDLGSPVHARGFFERRRARSRTAGRRCDDAASRRHGNRSVDLLAARVLPEVSEPAPVLAGDGAVDRRRRGALRFRPLLDRSGHARSETAVGRHARAAVLVLPSGSGREQRGECVTFRLGDARVAAPPARGGERPWSSSARMDLELKGGVAAGR